MNKRGPKPGTTTPRNKGTGKTFRWLVEHMGYAGDDCLIWPFSRIRAGYGALGVNGQKWRANRLMCVLAHGEPPSSKHHALHTCDNGPGGCVNPRHLRWGTNSENQAEHWKTRTVGTNIYGNRGGLNAEQVAEIRAMAGKCTKDSLAAKYGVSHDTIRRVQRHETYNRC